MKRPHKYSAKRTVYAGISYPSKAEAERAQQLDMLKCSNHVKGWERQVRFELGCPENRYTVDFVVTEYDGNQWAEDVKGYETATFKRNKRLWRSYGPMPLRIIKRVGGRLQCVQVIEAHPRDQ